MFFGCFLLYYMWFSIACTTGGDLEYSLNVGYAIDVFANYGDLSQVTQVVSSDYEDDSDSEELAELFREKSLRVFRTTSYREQRSDHIDDDMTFLFSDTMEDLLDNYFKDFHIEGTDKPWKAFMGDWVMDEVARALGIEYEHESDNCCYVLAKVARTHRLTQLDSLEYGVPVKDYVKRALDNLNLTDPEDIRRFMRSYGTHYIQSYMTGDAIYQVFTYKKIAYKMLKARMRRRNSSGKLSSDDLRFYFSSYFLKQVGDVMIASGNKSVQMWARRKLRDSQYLYSRPSVLKLHYSPILAYKLKNMLDNGALLGLRLNILRPIFNNSSDAWKYTEMVENDLKLWEVNA